MKSLFKLKKEKKLNKDDDLQTARSAKGKRGLTGFIFSYTSLVLVLVLVQLAVIILFFNFLGGYIPYLLGGHVVLGLLMVILMMNKSRHSAIKLSWAVLILISPVIGSGLYLLISMELGNRVIGRRLRLSLKNSAAYLRQDKDTVKAIADEAPESATVQYYLAHTGGFPAYVNQGCQYFPSGEAMLDDLKTMIRAAEHFIFLEYFIIDEGSVWDEILQLLTEKVKQGVEVRVLYDGTCSIARLPYRYPRQLKALGIECRIFSPIRPVFSARYNFRDHRKIAVIDGAVAYTGGNNLADEYANRKTLFGHWKDAAVRLEGNCVRSFTLMFLQMWDASETNNAWSPFLDVRKSELPSEGGYVIPFGSNPLDGERMSEMVYLDLINRAQKSVHVMTPYLILDDELTTALCFAARRGVETALLIPHVPDKKIAYSLACAGSWELIEAGVQIYEYTPGFVHSKMMISDENRAVVGTPNLDYRSLYHHFESAALLIQVPAIEEMETDFRQTLQKSQRLNRESLRKKSFLIKLLGRVFRLISPLM